MRIQPLFQGFGPASKRDEDRMEARIRGIDESGKKLLLTSDDPRRGGRIRVSDKYDQSSLAKQQIRRDHGNGVAQPPVYEKDDEKRKTDANIYKKADPSIIRSPLTMWKD